MLLSVVCRLSLAGAERRHLLTSLLHQAVATRQADDTLSEVAAMLGEDAGGREDNDMLDAAAAAAAVAG